ncbi:hypothetical protein [Paraburkholderia sp.]|uniref:hypothetical protein n=1 Tax=Paraburkholderia sp. TaxID=1926495 RepID=UPI0025D20CF7|nr:hypothetical protein [Paraburkholderia sp.]
MITKTAKAKSFIARTESVDTESVHRDDETCRAMRHVLRPGYERYKRYKDRENKTDEKPDKNADEKKPARGGCQLEAAMP